MKRVLVLAGLLAALAGCGGTGSSDSPAVLPPVTGSPTPVPSATATAAPLAPSPSTSAPATPPTEQEVEQTAGEIARHWVEVLNEAYATLDTTELQTLSTLECITCQNYVNGMAHARAIGERWIGGQLTVIDVAPAEPDEETTEVTVAFQSAPFYVLTAAGTRRGEQPAAPRVALQILVQNGPDSRLITQVLRL